MMTLLLKGAVAVVASHESWSPVGFVAKLMVTVWGKSMTLVEAWRLPESVAVSFSSR